MDIRFTDTIGVPDIFYPKPATKLLPDWYKNTEEYVSGERLVVNGNTPHSVKKCIPVFDAMSAGYIICTYVDVQVSSRDGLPWYEWPQMNAITFHPIEQAPLHPTMNGAPYPKWLNPWAIKTPKGYSTLFIPPMHNPNGIFTVLPGIVDTDSYFAPVNFPFVLNDVNWTGVIPAGTPLVQVIPFRRDTWKMKLGSQKDIKDQRAITVKLMSLWFNSYKRQFWTRKQYR